MRNQAAASANNRYYHLFGFLAPSSALEVGHAPAHPCVPRNWVEMVLVAPGPCDGNRKEKNRQQEGKIRSIPEEHAVISMVIRANPVQPIGLRYYMLTQWQAPDSMCM